MKIKFGKKKAIISLFGFLLILSAGAYSFISSGEAAETEKTIKANISEIVTDNGVVEAEGTITLTAKSPVEITKLYFSEGDYVNSGDVILSNNDTSAELDIESMKSQAAGISVQVASANDAVIKNKTLYEAGAISQFEYKASQTLAAQLSAQLSSLRYSIESYKSGSGIGGMISPISGYVTEIFADEGETVMPGMNVVEISPLDNYYIRLNLIPEEAVKVQVGNKVTLKKKDIVLIDNCQVKSISKKAKEVISSIGISQKRMEVVISVPEEVKALILGDNVDVEITTDLRENVLAIPSKAVFEKEEKKYVYTVINGKAVATEVEIGLEGEDLTQVIKGLAEGDTVIVSPSNSISDGSKLKI